MFRGMVVAGAPYFVAHLRAARLAGAVWFLSDTGAARTTILDRDADLLNLPSDGLTPLRVPLLGIGGPTRTSVLSGVELTIHGEGGRWRCRHDLCVARHATQGLSRDSVDRIMHLPSVLGRDILGRFGFWFDFRAGVVELRSR